MNCCDYDCNQGRDCPARVARVGQRYYAAKPLPPTGWRLVVHRAARALLLGIVGLWLIVSILISIQVPA